MNRLQEGDIIEIKEGHVVYADVPMHFVYENKKGCYELTHHDIRVGGDFSYFTGRYIVVKTTNDGGGTGHGPNDYYPSGHHVFCEKEDGTQSIDFYQTGSFTAMIKDIKPIGKAKRKWIIEE